MKLLITLFYLFLSFGKLIFSSKFIFLSKCICSFSDQPLPPNWTKAQQEGRAYVGQQCAQASRWPSQGIREPFQNIRLVRQSLPVYHHQGVHIVGPVWRIVGTIGLQTETAQDQNQVDSLHYWRDGAVGVVRWQCHVSR